MKKIFSLIMCLILIGSLSGCGNDKVNEKNNESGDDSKTNETLSNTLTCSGDYSLNIEFGGGCTNGNCTYAFMNDPTIRGMLDSEYVITFDGNQIQKIEGKEVVSAEESAKIIGQMDAEELEEELESNNAYIDSNDRVVFEVTIDSDFDALVALNQDIENKEDLKEILEEETGLICK